MIIHRIGALFLIFGLFLQPPSFATAAESDAYQSSTLTARLITVEEGVRTDARTISAGLSITLEEGWKTYWRSPGEVGLPPEVDLNASSNLAAAELLWPAPTRFRAFGIENFGYAGELTYPIRLTIDNPGEALDLKAEVSLLVCSNVCIPENFELTLSLPPGTGVDQTSAAEIALWAERVPVDGDASDVSLLSAALVEGEDALVVQLSRPSGWQTPDVFPELGDGTAFGAPDIRLSPDKSLLWARLPILYLSDPPSPLALTLTDGESAVTFDAVTLGTVPAEPPFTLAPPSRELSALIWIALLAFGGGVILNAMPCVLPVLSIKLSSALKIADGTHHRIRFGFLATAFGTLAFMWVLAALVLGLQSLGYAIGWGTQFQNPFFLVFLILVLGLFAAALFGVFEIRLPAGLATRLAGLGREGYVGDFATGAFAAILATPCSAPLLGTAIAFALTGSSLDVMVVFTAMGIGLALPYLVVAARPRLVAALPRPGRWMLVVKAGLGLLLLMTAAWLFWVLSGVTSPTLARWVAAALIVATLSLAVGKWGRATRWAPILAVPMVGAALALPAVMTVDARVEPRGEVIEWAAFERAEIARYVSQGHVVFVDVTADWCLTCKANKTLVLDRAPVVDALALPTVVAMRADWTRPDARIQAYLEANGRFGIPFNIVYGPAAPEGLPLSEILTPGAVMDAIEAALGDPIGLAGNAGG
ncbi:MULTISPECIES: protein-disulfide reductase DsbD [unclassified Roseovarius]|uniref:protein-disulfide reductase DsbD family protein n=1 Tax=unclassified Roseovarius TaxID=2614913 RepID=UPI00273FF403|nr:MULTISPECIES: protein-disulfide reductase DsbD domain-containing protein [unclassified Roseovarius]